MERQTRELAFKSATKACEVLRVNITTETLWSLVEGIYPILESGLTLHPADVAPRCPQCGMMLARDETREKHWFCSNGACR